MTTESEQLWIELVKNNKDSVALDNLVRRYRPMIDNMYIQYYISGFDRNDWYQEAALVCYQTCNLYNGTSGSKFGSFFKLKFKNRIIDIIRRENALKRKANNNAESLEYLRANDEIIELVSGHSQSVETSELIKNVLQEMSYLELVAFQYLLGKNSAEKICQELNCDFKKLMIIVRRCKLKISTQNFDLNLS